MKQKEIFQYILGAIIIVGFFTLLIILVFTQIPEQNKDLLNLVVGALIGSFGTVVTYNFGSSVGSAKKDDTINQALVQKDATISQIATNK